jgi:hypothetical protein
LENLFRINQTPIAFSESSANNLVPLIRRITALADMQIKAILERRDAGDRCDEAREKAFENQILEQISSWNKKIEKLGCVPKSCWVVDFDAGDGYFCWEYPNSAVTHWHEYSSAFAGRVLLTNRPSKTQE